MKSELSYANWWSKLLFKKNFEKQFYIPLPPRYLDRLFLKTLERIKFSSDFKTVPIEKPIFIVGLPRSGTTLLYNLLCAHERASYITNSINVFNEAPCSIEWLRKKCRFNIRGERFLADSIDTDFGSPSEPIMYWAKWFGRDVNELHWKELRARDLTEDQIRRIYLDIRKIIFSFGGESGGGRRFIVKYPLMQTELRLVQDLFPDAKFVHIVRDGRTVANSLIKLYRLSNEQLRRINHPLIKHIIPYPRVEKLKEYVQTFGPDQVDCTARVWRDAIEVTEAVRGSIHHFTQIKYEDLLKQPEKAMADVFQFCELSWPAPDNQNFQDLFASIGKLRHSNAYKDFDVIEKAVGKTLGKLGYLTASPST